MLIAISFNLYSTDIVDHKKRRQLPEYAHVEQPVIPAAGD